MKRVILLFVLSLVASVALPENNAELPQIVITKKNDEKGELAWPILPSIVEDKANKTVYLGYKSKEDTLKLYPEIKNAFHDLIYKTPKDLRSKSMSKLFHADKKIFIKGYNGKTYGSFTESGEMVNTDNGLFLSKSYISFPKAFLPVKLTFDGDCITVVEFDSTNVEHCEAIRRISNVYKELPECQSDTLPIDSLPQRVGELLGYKQEIGNSKYWTFTVKFFINDIECSGKESITDSILENVKNAKKATVRYEMHCKHDYFPHTRKGVLAEIVVKEETQSWFATALAKAKEWVSGLCCIGSFCDWRMIALVFALIVFFVIVLRRRKQKNVPVNAQKPVISEDTEHGTGEEPVAPVNVDDEEEVNAGFVRRILAILGVTVKPIKDNGQNKDIEELLAQKDEKIRILNARIEELNKNGANGGHGGGTPDPNHDLDEINKLKEQLAQKDEEIQKMKARIEELIDKGGHGGHGGGVSDPPSNPDENKALKEQLAQKDEVIAGLNVSIKELEKKNKEQQELLTQKNGQIANLNAALGEKNKRIEELQKEKNELQVRLADAIKKNKNLAEENAKLADKVNSLRVEIDSLKAIIAEKDKQIVQYLQQIKKLEDQLSKISRQNMYLLQVDDVLKEVSNDILLALENVENEELKKKLVQPLLNGVSGLDMGLTTYYKRWQEQVMNVRDEFFGSGLYEMTDNEVKSKLVSGFLKNLAQGDTFSKLARLYMYIQADWINEILIRNGFDVDMIEQIFCRLKMLFNDFGIEIIYPRLFVDKMDDSLYIFDPRCDVFSLFPISEEMRISYSRQSDLIVDVIQVGVKIKSANYNRKAIVTIPNF